MKISKIITIFFAVLLLFQNIAFASDTTPPSNVNSFMGEAGDGHVQLSWAAASDDVGIAGYEVHYGFTSVTSPGQKYDYVIDSAFNAIQVAALSNGSTYYFAVKAYDTAENISAEFSNEISLTPYSTSPPETDSDYLPVEIIDYEIGGNYVLMNIVNQNLSPDYTYYASCHVVEDLKHTQWFDKRFVFPQPSENVESVELMADGLRLETDYYCYAGIVNPLDNVILHSEDIFLKTSGDVAQAENIFSDVAPTHKNKDAISFLYSLKIVNGYSDGTFKPENEINRAELIKVLVEATGMDPSSHVFSNCFSDVHDEWFARYICYAQWAGWVNGYPDGNFRPAQTVNKAEAIKMLLNSQGVEVSSTVSENPFSDVPKDSWFAPFVTVAKNMGILEETGDYLYPGENMKRAGVCENLYRSL